MHVCFVLYVYIIQAHRTRYMSHPSHMATQKTSAQEYKTKLKNIVKQLANHLKTTRGKEKKKNNNLSKHYPPK